MLTEELILKMTKFDEGDPKRIQHFIKVYQFAHLIGVRENIAKEELRILEIAAILHDIGIRPCEQKYGNCNGKLQEKEGPAYARELLKAFSEVTALEVDRVCFLIAHHHTYDNVEGIDWRILLEADFLVNALEDGVEQSGMLDFREKVFRTRTGLWLLNTMYGL